MNICMLAPEFIPVWGGVGTYIVELVRHLPKDTQIHVVTPEREKLGKQKISSTDFDFSKLFGKNVQVHFVCKAKDTFFYNAKFQYECAKFVPKLIKDEKIDIIHSHTAHMPDLLLEFKKHLVPIVTTIHTTIRGQRKGTKSSGMHFWGLEFSEKLTYLAYPLLNLAENVYFSKKRSYITVSDWMKNQINTQYPKINPATISVIHNSVDTNSFSPSQNKRQADIVLFTGRLIAAKGINYLVEAIPNILKCHPETKFVFIGAGNASPYKKRLKTLDVAEQNYDFMGYLKDTNEMLDYYRQASVYVAPTLYENLPIRILEAMACGTPVVASNVCAIPEAIDNDVDGILTQPRSPQELTNAICLLLDDVNLRRKMGSKAREKVLEKFSWEINTAKTTAVYKQILENQPYIGS